MATELQTIIHAVLQRAPEWIRHDMASKDAGLRERAEESLAAIIANAIAENGSAAAQG